MTNRNMRIVKSCRWCNKQVVLRVSKEDFIKWNDGTHIQFAMPYLNSGEREILISGTCNSCFDKFFNDDDD